MFRSTQVKAYLAAALYAIIISLSFLFVKLALTVSDPMDAMAHRFTISWLAISIPVLFGWVRLHISWKDILRILPLSLLYPAMFFSLQVYGLSYSSSSEGGIIQATVPIFTMILAAIFLKERTTLWQKLSVMVSVAGVVFIFIMQGAELAADHLMGISLLVLSCLSFAGYNVLARPLSQKFKAMEISFIMLTIGFVCFNGMALVKHGLDGSIQTFLQPLTSPTFVLSTLYLGVLSSLVTTLLLTYAISRLEASKLSVFSNLSTLISMGAGVVFLGEKLEYYHVIGAVMIVAGVLGTNFLDKVRLGSRIGLRAKKQSM
ncbi:DMT family transporter [Paenibacillus sp. UNC451MF]|uniref:DMT family transporter n=1 Tax=Paenibacillus sp. UNC451MF TaxID=1449063 RepID=UPI00048F3670|nr:DMT family transporter [Paenibacillus sp. UNC451MF]